MGVDSNSNNKSNNNKIDLLCMKHIYTYPCTPLCTLGRTTHTDRMHDKQATVRRAAMTLVGRLLQHNPFCGDLSIAPLQATLATLTAQLEEHAARCGMHTNGEVVGDQGDGGGMRDGNGHDGAEWEVEDLAAMVQGTPVAASPAAAAVIKRERHVEDVPGDVEQQDGVFHCVSVRVGVL